MRKATSTLLTMVLPFLELGDNSIAFQKAQLILSARMLVPDSFLYSFNEVLAKNCTIFFSSSQLREAKLHNATMENPISTMDLNPPIILKYYQITNFPRQQNNYFVGFAARVVGQDPRCQVGQHQPHLMTGFQQDLHRNRRRSHRMNHKMSPVHHSCRRCCPCLRSPRNYSCPHNLHSLLRTCLLIIIQSTSEQITQCHHTSPNKNYHQSVIRQPIKININIIITMHIGLINIIQLMKPERAPKQRRQNSQGLPAIENNGFNQTIIINNPNFNINYIEHPGFAAKPNSRQNNNKTNQELPLYDPKNSSKGIDAWNLNKNLKEFSETRQLGFFKGNGSKAKSNADLQHSPYLSHKTKTQDIKPYMKIKSNGTTIQPSSFRENKTISTIKHEASLFTPRDRSALSNFPPAMATLDPQDQSKTTFRRRKFQSKSRNPKPVDHLESLEPYSREEIELTETIPNNGYHTERKINPIAMVTRRNRFVELEKTNLVKATSRRQNDNEEEADLSDLETSLIIGDSPRKAKTPNESVPTKGRAKNFGRSIQKISKCFLSRVDNYFDQPPNLQMPTSKIQLYTTTMQQPASYSYNIDYKSSPIGHAETGYDFAFEEEKSKPRPKTPYKRKKMYEEIN